MPLSRAVLRALRRALPLVAACALAPAAAAQAPGPAPAVCTIEGRVASGGVPLPGVSIAARAGDALQGLTSTGVDGRFRLPLPGGVHTLTADLTGFAARTGTLRVAPGACPPAYDLELALAPRDAAAATPAPERAARFQNLAIERDRTAAGVDPDALAEAEATGPVLALPPGFSSEALTGTIALAGEADVDEDTLRDRFAALERGELPGPQGDAPQRPGPAGRAGGPGAGGGFGGRGGFQIGGRGGRLQTYALTANYQVAGSALDAAPFRLRGGGAVDEPSYARHDLDVTVGGPVRIPGLYDGTGRTTFQFSYDTRLGRQLFDEYATVPTAALRAGDFSGLSTPLVDPLTGAAFSGNVIPAGRLSPAALALLPFIPQPNLDGDTRNFRYSTTERSTANNFNLQLTHRLSPATAQAGGRGRGGAARGGGQGRGGAGGPAGTAVQLSTRVRYQQQDSDRLDVFPSLSGTTRSSSLSVPVTLNVARGASTHQFGVSVTRSAADTTGQYAGVLDVAGQAGIVGVSTDPLTWGVPDLSFTTFTSLTDVTPSRRRDTRLAASYTWTRRLAAHTVRVGGEIRRDWSSSRTDADANGAFVFTGLYAAAGAAEEAGLDFADFLLGLPQQATVQFGPGSIDMRGREVSLFAQDDWRLGGNWSLNLGVRYERQSPFVEADGQMVNLDVAPDFSAVAPVVAGGAGAFTGAFPVALVETDGNNVAPRLGFAWRAATGTVVRGGYGISFNNGSYAAIARRLTGQPPFAVTSTGIGAPGAPLALTDPLASVAPGTTTNDFGVDRTYDLGLVQTWNVAVSRTLARVWNVDASYTHVRGSSLDLVRAPNRGADGLRLAGVQPFTWQTSEGSSRLHSLTVAVRRRSRGGVGTRVEYTLSRSRDNAASIGGGGTVVAQDERDLDAEWGLSSFDRRHDLSAGLDLELPFGPNGRWLTGGGLVSTLAADWSLDVSFQWRAGTPLTPRVLGAASDIAVGTNGTLRADYDGGAIGLDEPTADRFFNTDVFSVPAAGTFGTAARNLIIGPGSQDVSARLQRAFRVGDQSFTVEVRASNLLNRVTYSRVNTVVNSPSFGQVTGVRPMRSVDVRIRYSL